MEEVTVRLGRSTLTVIVRAAVVLSVEAGIEAVISAGMASEVSAEGRYIARTTETETIIVDFLIETVSAEVTGGTGSD